MKEPSSERLKEMYRTMLRIRWFEEEADRQLTLGRVQGGLHLYCGEEAIAVGVCAHLRVDDYVFGTHRSHGHCLAKGAPMDGMMAELFGRRDGLNRGKGGSMHIADARVGMLGADGIVAAGFGLATGTALASKLRGEDKVTVCFFGDGAVFRGPFHECLNMASLWDLPIVYICENNGYQQYTSQKNLTKTTSPKDLAPGYKMPGVSADGQDVIKVAEVAAEAIERARGGGGPSLVEFVTYRYFGHNPGDPQGYRTKEEVEFWRKERDPIALFRRYLMERQQLSEADDEAIRGEVVKEVEAAVAYADASPLPDAGDMVTDVFSWGVQQ